MILTAVGNVVEILLRRQESVTSEDIKSVLARAGVQISDSELAKALMTLEIYKKIYVRRVRRENREVFQIFKRK